MAEVRPHRRHAPREGRGGAAVGAHLREPALEIVDGRVSHGALAERGQCGQVPAVRVDRTRRAARGEQQQVAREVGIGGGGGHDARMDSRGRRRLLSEASLGRLPLRAAVPLALVVTLLVAVSFPSPADASQLVARNTSSERIVVSKDGRALVTYHAKGSLHRVLAWGAVNADAPSQVRRQVGFELDYSGGWGRFGRPVWKSLRNVCGPYRGPALPWVVAACTAPDGSHWALQSWRRSQANFGLPPWKPGHGARELRLSHWRGPVARFEVLARLELRRPLAPPLRSAHVPRAARARLHEHA